MSTMESIRAAIHLHRDERDGGGGPRKRVVVAIVVLGVIAVLALGEIAVLPTFSADDFGSILFGGG